MVSLKAFTIFLIVFTINELQGASGVDVRNAPQPQTGSISKRSIKEVMQIIPWMRNGLSRLTRANGTGSGITASLGSSFSRLFGQRAAAEDAHNVSRRSIGVHSSLDPANLRTLPSGGLFSHSHAPVFSLSGILANPQQTILYLHSNGPLSLLRPAVPTPAPLSPLPAPATPVVIKSDEKLVVVVNNTLPPLAEEAILLPAAPEGIPVAATIAPLAVPAIADESIIAAAAADAAAALSLTTPEPTSAPVESARDDIQFISDQSSIS